MIILWKSYYGYYGSCELATQAIWGPTGWAAPVVWSTPSVPKQRGGTNPLQYSREPRTPTQKEFHFVLTQESEGNPAQMHSTHTDNFLQCFISHLAPGIALELRYCHLGTPLRGWLLAHPLSISMYRTASAAAPVTNSSSCTKLHLWSCSVGTARVFSQVRISHFSE